MRNKPDAAELVEVARETLLGELLDEAPDDPQALMRMAARAFAIAARETQTGDEDLVSELRLLGELYGEDAVKTSASNMLDRVAQMNRRFARDIRDGTFDGACAPGVRALLLEQVRARLRISNPGYLEAAGLD